MKWLDDFIEHYNEKHRHCGIRMVTPGARFRGEDVEILRRRRETMLRARQQAPERWIKPEAQLNCEPVGKVLLNPENGQLREAQPVAHA